ncbi:MAG: hypothetical protein ACRD3D_17085 [Terriglobia bacterium]
MKSKRLEALATIGLAVVCAALVFHLAVRVRSVDAGGPAVQARSAIPRARTGGLALAGLFAARKPQALPNGPVLNLSLYRETQSETLAAYDRNPFSFEPTAQQLEQQTRSRAAAQGALAGPPAPPPPPPLPFKAIGYSMQAQGSMEAYLSDTQQVYALHEGEMFDKNYHVIRITPALIEVQDDAFHRTVELPFPQ